MVINSSVVDFQAILKRNTSAPLDHCLPLACRCGIWSANKLKAKVDKYFLNKVRPVPCKETSDFALQILCRNSPFSMPRDVCRGRTCTGTMTDTPRIPQGTLEPEPQQIKCHFLFISTWCIYSVSTAIGLPANAGTVTVYLCPGRSCCRALGVHRPGTHRHALCSHIFPPNKCVNADI